MKVDFVTMINTNKKKNTITIHSFNIRLYQNELFSQIISKRTNSIFMIIHL